jgi:hypothetical protein
VKSIFKNEFSRKHLTPHLLGLRSWNTIAYSGEVFRALLTTPHPQDGICIKQR